MVCAAQLGCQVIRHGKWQTIEVHSDPPGADVRVEPIGTFTVTPGSVAVPRKSQGAAIRIEKEGYELQRIMLKRSKAPGNWRNIVWIHPIGIIIGLIVDYSVGAAYEQSPDSISVKLEEAQ